MASVTIYSTPHCPYCMRAKALLSDMGVTFEEKNVPDHADEHRELSEKYNWQTVPMIFIGEEFIGGYDDLAALRDAGTLQAKLDA